MHAFYPDFWIVCDTKQNNIMTSKIVFYIIKRNFQYKISNLHMLILAKILITYIMCIAV